LTAQDSKQLEVETTDSRIPQVDPHGTGSID
jgi:hypothetical protein